MAYSFNRRITSRTFTQWLELLGSHGKLQLAIEEGVVIAWNPDELRRGILMVQQLDDKEDTWQAYASQGTEHWAKVSNYRAEHVMMILADITDTRTVAWEQEDGIVLADVPPLETY